MFKPKTLVCLLALLACWFSMPAYAGRPGGTNLPPLTPDEFSRVVKELSSQRPGIPESLTSPVFVDATAERIDRLLNMPSFSDLPSAVKDRAIENAGKGFALRFDKPSDVMDRIVAWYPDEVFATRKERKFTRHFRYAGVGPSMPVGEWSDEAAAFFHLWQCMPHSAFQYPKGNPFLRRDGDSVPLAQNIDCKENTFADREHEKWRKEMRSRELRMISLLHKKFKAFLAVNRCTGTGPDDCVLVLSLWGDGGKSDPELAAMLQTLEPEIGLGRSLYELYRAVDPEISDGPHHLDEALRRAAFLRVKLLSVLDLPSAWRPQALADTLNQMNFLLLQFLDSNAHYSRYDLYSGDRITNPWMVARKALARYPGLRTAVVESLLRLPADARCAIFPAWKSENERQMSIELALREMASGVVAGCTSPDWKFLINDSAAEDERDRVVELIRNDAHGEVREAVIDKLTVGGASCFGTHAGDVPWVSTLCQSYVSEPQLAASQLLWQSESAYGVMAIPTSESRAQVRRELESWLRLTFGASNQTIFDGIRAQLDSLNLGNAHVSAARIWRRPDGKHAIVEIHLDHELHPMVVLSIDALSVKRIVVPSRFRTNNNRNELAYVSDVDGDGAPEIWWSDRFDFCTRDVNDLNRNLDCSPRQLVMGEVFGETLTFYRRASETARTTDAQVVLPDEKPFRSKERAQCNGVLVSYFLRDRKRGKGADENPWIYRNDVISSACKPHPKNSNLVVVALFSELHNRNSDGLSEKSFTFAVIDPIKDKVLRLYRDRMSEDGSTRIGSHSLSIDTGRYELASGVRALGVRMDVNYSPRCAEGGSDNYLTLFVEEGGHLRPVLKDMAMTSWSLTEGPVCGNESTTIEESALTLHLAPTSTNGWRDLIVKKHVTAIRSDLAAEIETRAAVVTTIVGTARMKGKVYVLEK